MWPWMVAVAGAVAGFFAVSKKHSGNQDAGPPASGDPTPLHRDTVRRVLLQRGAVEEAIATRRPLRVAEVLALITQESAGRTDALGRAGEVGLMQVKPDAALADYNAEHGTAFDAEDLTVSGVNIEVGTWYLHQQYERAGNFHDALRAYNAGWFGSQRSPEVSKEYADSVQIKTAQWTAILDAS